MKSGNKPLQEILGGKYQYVVPLFQRYYQWGDEQWMRLWEDLEPLFANEKKSHFMGFIVLVPESAEPGMTRHAIAPWICLRSRRNSKGSAGLPTSWGRSRWKQPANLSCPLPC